MSEITVLFLYITAGVLLALTRLPRHADRSQLLIATAIIAVAVGLALHATSLWSGLDLEVGLSLSLANTVSFIGLQLALIALIAAVDPALRGLSGGWLILAGITALLTGSGADIAPSSAMTWQLQAHVLVSLFAYGLLTVGAIVAVYALVQDVRLRAGNLSTMNHLFAPLVTTEKLLIGITGAGFAILLLAVLSGLAFVDNLFAQHLAHKTALSLVALALFGTLLIGRQFAGWRGRTAVYLYLCGFALLGLGYYGSRYILENVLGRSWS